MQHVIVTPVFVFIIAFVVFLHSPVSSGFLELYINRSLVCIMHYSLCNCKQDHWLYWSLDEWQPVLDRALLFIGKVLFNMATAPPSHGCLLSGAWITSSLCRQSSRSSAFYVTSYPPWHSKINCNLPSLGRDRWVYVRSFFKLFPLLLFALLNSTAHVRCKENLFSIENWI